MAINKDFYGQGWQFPPGFDTQNGTTRVVKDLESIRQSLNVLMGTHMGERLMQPTYGTRISAQFFRTVDTGTATMMQATILDAIVDFEPRITANSVKVDTSRMYEGILLVTIDFTVRSTNSRNNIVFPFYLKEGNLVPANLQ
jgi:phage baseplate assembly protein W